jgi:hypothetical protein
MNTLPRVNLLAILTLVLVTGCICFPTRITDAPLPPDEEARLAELLVGTWSIKAMEDRRGNVESETQSFIYTFRDDGTGQYDQRAYGVRGQNPFEWRLEGRNLLLSMERGGRTTTFRVDEYEVHSMRWFNYLDSGYFHMGRDS